MFDNFFFSRKSWKNILQPGRGTVWGITNATNTHSEYVKLVAFPLQQWLRERASKLRDCLSCQVLRRVIRKEYKSLKYGAV